MEHGPSVTGTEPQETSVGVGHLGLILVLFLVPLVVAALRSAPPEPIPARASSRQFSAERALEEARSLAGPVPSPHPVGSPEASALRDRLVESMRRKGWSPAVESTLLVGPEGIGRVHNVSALLPGATEECVLVMAHTDSVRAGAGVADDLIGVATVLEAARARLAMGPLERSLLLLLTDGEEAGLQGARAFVENDPRFEDVVCVLNLEARGCRGPSVLFQAGPGSADLLRGWSSASALPLCDGITAAAYERMPNDTDFSETLAAGRAGLNFAFLGGVEVYHTPLDDFEHLDPRSVQHQGEHLLAGLLAADGVVFGEQSPVTWVSPFLGGLWVLPRRLMVPLAGTWVLLLGLALALCVRRGALSGVRLGMALRRVPLLLGSTVVAARAMQALTSTAAGSTAALDLSPGLGWLVVGGGVLLWLTGVLCRHRGAADAAHLAVAAHVWSAVATFLLALASPSAVPSLVLAGLPLTLVLFALAPGSGRGPSPIAQALGAASFPGLLHWGPLLLLFVDAFGGRSVVTPVAMGLLVAGSLLLPLTALEARLRRVVALLGFVALAAGLAGLAFLPSSRPDRHNLLLIEEDGEWTLDGEALALDGLESELPRLEELEGTEDRARLRLSGPVSRGLLRLEGVERVSAEGRSAPVSGERMNLFGWTHEDLTLDLALEAGEEASAEVWVEVPLNAIGLDLSDRRRPGTVPSGVGDRLRMRLTWGDPGEGQDASEAANPEGAEGDGHGH